MIGNDFTLVVIFILLIINVARIYNEVIEKSLDGNGMKKNSLDSHTY